MHLFSFRGFCLSGVVWRRVIHKMFVVYTKQLGQCDYFSPIRFVVCKSGVLGSGPVLAQGSGRGSCLVSSVFTMVVFVCACSLNCGCGVM